MKFLVVMDAIGTGGISTAFLNFIDKISQYVDCDILVFDDTSIPNGCIPSKVKILNSCTSLRLMGMPFKKVKQKSKALAFIRSMFVLLSKAISGSLARNILISFTRPLKGYDAAISYTQDVGWHTLARGCNNFVLNKVDAAYKAAFIHCDYAHYGGYHKKQERIYKKFDGIFCVSEGCKEIFDRCFPKLKNKTRVMENYTNVEKIREKAQEYHVDYPKGLNIVTVCRLSEEKGICRALSAFARLKEKKNDFLWTIVGDGDDYKNIVNCIQKHQLQNNVQLVGSKKNPYPYIQEADVFFLPSLHEAAPMVFGESWALGTPIISTETCSSKQMVEENQIGFVCENSEDGIYSILNKLLCGELDFADLKGLKNLDVNKNATIQFANLLSGLSQNGNRQR